MAKCWDVAVVGSGPAGAAAALGVLTARPGSAVLLLDRADLPRDKACGDGVAPHVLDELAALGVTGLLDDRVPVPRLVLRSGTDGVDAVMSRPAYVVPRTVLDARIAAAATASGAVPQRFRVRSVRADAGGVTLTGERPGETPLPRAGRTASRVRARVVVGADGAASAVRTAIGVPAPHRSALAIRGYAPVQPQWRGRQGIVFADPDDVAGGPAYAWSFDRGDGVANVGYGQVLRPGRPAPQRAALIAALDRLLPGVADGGTHWRGHHLPLSSGRVRHPDGPVLLAGDAASLVNPMTGEGIYDAVVSGALAGRAAAAALDDARSGPAGAGRRYRAAVRARMGRHHRHTDLAARLVGSPAVVGAGLRAAAGDQRLFDDLVEVGLAHGALTRRVVAGLARELLRGVVSGAAPGAGRRPGSPPHR